MDNFTALLQQFHIKQQQQTASHEQFAEIIDYIRNEKQSKQSLITRKKQQKTKLIHKMNKYQERSSESTPKLGTEMDIHEKTFSLQQIKNLVLQKEYDEVEKQVNTVRKMVKQMQNQLAVFTRKDNEIKQLRYSSKRQLQVVQLETTNQKNYIIQMQQKYQRLLQQLNLQKINLEHQNRYLASQLKQMKSITKNYKITNLSDSNYVSPLSHDYFKIEELYTKKKLQEVLRSFNVIFVVKNNWNDQHVHKKFTQMKLEADKDLYLRSHFYFFSKKQIIQYYLQKLGYQSLKSLSMLVIDLHRNMIKNIEKLQRKCNNLNNKIIQLNGQNDRLVKVIKSLQTDALKTSIILIAQIDNQLLILKQNIRKKNSSIFQILQKQFKIVDRFKRIIQTLEKLIDLNSNNKQNCTHSLAIYPPFHKKPQINHKQRKHSGNNINTLTIQHSNLSKNNIGTTKCINLHKKCSSSWSKSVFKKGESQLSQFQTILTRNPIQTLIQWYSIVKNGRHGANLLETIFTNDLYRLFYDPYDYDSSFTQIENQRICIKKVEESTKKLLESLKKNIILTINNILQSCQKLQNKTKNTSNQAEVNRDQKNDVGSLSQTRYVIESKGYFRRDDYKFLEKLEKMQLKKQGLYIPYRYGVEVDQQINNSQRTSTKFKQTKLQYLQKSKKLSLRKPRYTAPQGSNYISSHRQRLNRADKKIRDLLKNADDLRVKTKVELSRAQRKKNTQSNVLL